jgi:acyl-coenzyme A thioesterase PaaI-like protein
MNVAEMASGLAMVSGLPNGVRSIVREIRMEYLKKARGTIRAVSRVTIPTVTGDMDHEVTADCLDPSGAVVARATVSWRLGLAPEQHPAGTGSPTAPTATTGWRRHSLDRWGSRSR